MLRLASATSSMPEHEHTHDGKRSSPTEAAEGEQPDQLGELEGFLHNFGGHLRDEGPEVDHAALFAYIDKDLEPSQLQVVAHHIRSYRTWFNAYLDTMIDLKVYEEIEAVAARLPRKD